MLLSENKPLVNEEITLREMKRILLEDHHEETHSCTQSKGAAVRSEKELAKPKAINKPKRQATDTRHLDDIYSVLGEATMDLNIFNSKTTKATAHQRRLARCESERIGGKTSIADRKADVPEPVREEDVGTKTKVKGTK